MPPVATAIVRELRSPRVEKTKSRSHESTIVGPLPKRAVICGTAQGRRDKRDAVVESW